METRMLGDGLAASAIGLGCMGMSGMYGPSDRAEGLATIRAAIDAGVTLIDTGDFYGMGHNEMLIAEALKGVPRDAYRLSVKFGALRDPAGGWAGSDARPAALRNFLAYSLQRLGVDHVDVYRPARVDPAVPIEDTVGALADLVKAGWVRHVGLSEVGADTLRRAAAVHPICDLQIEWSLVSRGLEAEVLPAARALGIGITAYGVLSRGLIGGHMTAPPTDPRDFRAHCPRFQAEAAAANLRLAERLRTVAAGLGATPAQAAIAWVLAQGPDVVALVGARRPHRLAEALGAVALRLSSADRAALEAAAPADAVIGQRYPAPAMASLDSERRA